MQSLNDDMDDLFRKAAEDYPLKTNNADWDKVLGRLNAPDAPLPEPVAKKGDGYKKLLWLLLLIPLAFGVKLVSDSSSKHAKQQLIQSVDKTNTTKNANTDKSNSGSESKIAKEETGSANTATVVAPEKNKVTQQSGTSDKQTTTAREEANKGNKDANTFTLQKLPAIKQSVASGNTTGNVSATQQANADNAGGKNQLETNNKTTGSNEINNTTGANNLPGATVTVPAAAAANNAAQQSSASAGTTSTGKDSGTKASTEEQKQAARAKNVKKTESYSLQKGLYLSIIGGPDFSTIKGQNVDMGYSIGLLVGYRFAKKFSAEAGVLWDKKSYYSDGKYFKTNKINLPSYVSILNVDGNCKMIEIPINVRYDFATRKKGSWYVTAGSSTYLMKKEDYNYDYTRYNMPYSGYKEYSNSTNNWFSIINVSAGYEKKIGKTSAIRLEPYIKIPASGVGIGSMPITSFGVYAGFTKHFK